MNLADILRNSIALANTITSDLQTTVAHSAWIGQDRNGKPLYDTAVNRAAIVEYKTELRRIPSGEEIAQTATITIVGPIDDNGAADRREPVDPRDKFVLPNGFSGPILDVSGVIDPSTGRPYTITVTLGGDSRITRLSGR